MTDNNLCPECALPDTIEHYFYECHVSYTFWRNLEQWLKITLGAEIHLNMFNILFGTDNEDNDNVLFLLDYCILLGKYYIFKQKLLEKNVSFIGYLFDLKHDISIVKYNLFLENKGSIFELKWKSLYEAV